MIITIQPSGINGSIKAPASKSVAQRALAASLLAGGKTQLTGCTESEDTLAALEVIKKMGANVTQEKDSLLIAGNYPIHKKEQLEINCGESGLSSRLFAPLALLYSANVTVNGKGSLLKRPFADLMKDTFLQMGINYTDNNGKLPLHITGELLPENIIMDGSGGSQFLSGILMTLPLLPKNTVVSVQNLKSKPYIDITLNVLSAFGIKVTHNNYETFNIEGNQKYIASNFNIEGDWSGASCLLVAGAIAGYAEVLNLDYNSQQADKLIVNVLQTVGANVEINKHSVKVTKNKLLPFDFDATHCPDLFPALAALAANCNGVSTIKGVSRLATKESNRALTLQTEFAKIGIRIELNADIMTIKGDIATGGTVFSHNDHRIAMAMATAALTAKAPVTLEGADCVNKSYPGFWDDLKAITN